MTKPGLLMIGPMMPLVMDALDEAYTVHRYWEADDRDALVAALRARSAPSPPTDTWARAAS